MAIQHTTEFRQEAVRVALTSGLSGKQSASDTRGLDDIDAIDRLSSCLGCSQKLKIEWAHK